MSFNKIFKGAKKEEAKRKEEQKIRLTAIINEAQELFERRAVNYYELMDILNNLQNNCNMRIAEILQSNHNQINKLINDRDKSNKSRGQENKK